ncbi:MAG: hypothetical protein ACHP7O_03925 [Burkholderiales bacterium]
MTSIVAFFILALGIAIGYRLPGPIAKLEKLYRRHTFKPKLLRAYSPDDVETKAGRSSHKPTGRGTQP